MNPDSESQRPLDIVTMSKPGRVILQNAKLRDLGALHKIEQVCFGKDAWPLLDLIAILSLPGVVRLKAVDEKQMVGFVSGDPKPAQNLGWITSICVLPDYQGQGIGSSMMEECEKKMGLPRIRLCVRRSNHNAIHLYTHLGYREVDVWPAYYFDREDGLILEKIRNSL
jgi:ribosomal protein S18 acetylase RimI-like enzyme